MNWYKNNYKVAISINNFSDRNLLNKQIRDLKQIASTLSYLSKYVYQNAPDAKRAVYTIALDKKMSSFPRMKESLLDAHRIALDNYKKFADICLWVVDELVRQIKSMENQRKDFVKTISIKKRTKR